MLGALFICMENGQTKALTTGKCAIVCIWLGKKENFLFSVSILHQCRGTSTSIVYVLRSLEWCLRGFCHLLPARFPRNAVVWLVLWERVETKRGGGAVRTQQVFTWKMRAPLLCLCFCVILRKLAYQLKVTGCSRLQTAGQFFFFNHTLYQFIAIRVDCGLGNR